jgi:uracil-DNA glycosylase family 4
MASASTSKWMSIHSSGSGRAPTPPSKCTNAVKCFPCDGAGSNREPTAAERANCRPYLREELATVAPDAVLTTGKHATASVFAMDDRSVDGFLDLVLDPVETGVGRVVPLLHPSYQAVWLARLDHTRESYLAELRAVLETAGTGD